MWLARGQPQRLQPGILLHKHPCASNQSPCLLTPSAPSPPALTVPHCRLLHPCPPPHPCRITHRRFQPLHLTHQPLPRAAFCCPPHSGGWPDGAGAGVRRRRRPVPPAVARAAHERAPCCGAAAPGAQRARVPARKRHLSPRWASAHTVRSPYVAPHTVRSPYVAPHTVRSPYVAPHCAQLVRRTTNCAQPVRRTTHCAQPVRCATHCAQPVRRATHCAQP
eukprot:350755-Chlamydomonas_euryale.AAC.7